MRNPYPFSKSLLALAVVGVSLSACKDDDGDSKPVVGFASSTLSASESNGTIEVEVELDKAASQDITVTYNLGGTARDRESGGAINYDYTIAGTAGEITIEEGETSATIEIALNDDGIADNNETIVLSLDDVEGDRAVVGDDDEITITVADGVLLPQVSFSESTLSLYESDDETEIEVILDRAATTDITVTYEVAGTATDAVTAEAEDLWADYEIEDQGTVVIKAGQTSATILLSPITDIWMEDDPFTEETEAETIELSITNVSTGAIISANNTLEIDLLQEAGLFAFLGWGTEGNEYPDVDMDLIFWLKQSGSLQPFAASSYEGPEYFEAIFIPDVLPNGQYGLSYSYTSGTENEMQFFISFTHYAEGGFDNDNSTEFTETYSLADITDWRENGVSSIFLSQTFDQTDDGFDNFSAIMKPSNAGRLGAPAAAAGSFPAKLQRKTAPRSFLHHKAGLRERVRAGL
ncbi:Calx-beta domain-containing protein [Dawidia soli]|uniref:Calx-beta domain-containing protein n=1 Tax=Dawidia soli TaxID=2782352 RepID=A0AAP2DAG3_9BACT|nr:Calx-beta domain-containing protein [Dawidia soli]MBT1688413.1 hypothetical protein [Dawidia soli]